MMQPSPLHPSWDAVPAILAPLMAPKAKAKSLYVGENW